MIYERRQYIRVLEEAEITYKILSESRTSMFITKDISQGGICFYVQEAIPESSLLEVRFSIEKIPFSFKTVVKTRWIRKVPNADCYEVGVEFTNMSEQATQYLMRYINSVVKKGSN